MVIETNNNILMNIILLLSLFAIIFILYIEPKLNIKKIKNKNEHGSSKFADIKEIDKTFRKENLNDIQDGGFPIWFEKKNKKFESVYFDDSSPHWTLIGSTGSGKSTCVVLPECIMFATAKKKRSIIVTDPKGEIFTKTSRIFKDNGYNIITIDFRNPNLSNRINIMQPIIDEWKLHCEYHKKLFICICYLYDKLKIDYDLFITDETYRNKIKNKNSIDNYIIEYMLDKVDTINDNLENMDTTLNDKDLFKNEFKDIKNKTLSVYFKEMSIKLLLEHIKKFQNDSSSHQAETIRLTNSLADLIFSEKESKDPFWLNSSKSLFKGLCGILLEDYQKGYIKENKINIASIKKFQNSSLIKENQIYLQRNLNNREYGTLSKDYLTSIMTASENTYKSIVSVFSEKMQIFDDLNVENITSISEFEFTSIAKEPTAFYIIVPDEDKSYYQLVTIIIGILYKDLTKFANLPENKGTLPRPIEWILDEFCNSPPLSSIETLISVARSRKMRFQLFIQSFAQLEQVYGKEIASIILDNCALCYLKTNTVETANVIANKLGKATIETSSISQSTDQFKIGANKTTSLLGRELLTANEIISLKYKTIIFPTVSNPIFRDTYLYTDIFKEYKEFNPIERPAKIIKKNTENYYTVEQMRINYEIPEQNEDDNSYNDNFIKQNNYMQNSINKIEQLFNAKSQGNKILINKKISKYEENKVLENIDPMVVVEINILNKSNETIIAFFYAQLLENQL